MNKTVNKLDLTKEIENCLVDISQTTVKKVMDTVWDVIKDKLVEGNQVSITGFGNFYVKERAARIGRNPSNGEKIQIEATKAPGFKPGKQLKDAVKNC